MHKIVRLGLNCCLLGILWVGLSGLALSSPTLTSFDDVDGQGGGNCGPIGAVGQDAIMLSPDTLYVNTPAKLTVQTKCANTTAYPVAVPVTYSDPRAFVSTPTVMIPPGKYCGYVDLTTASFATSLNVTVTYKDVSDTSNLIDRPTPIED